MRLIHKGKQLSMDTVRSAVSQGAVFQVLGEKMEDAEGLVPKDIEVLMLQMGVERNVAVRALKSSKGDLIDAMMAIGNKWVSHGFFSVWLLFHQHTRNSSCVKLGISSGISPQKYSWERFKVKQQAQQPVLKQSWFPPMLFTLPPASYDLGPCKFLFGDSLAWSKCNEQTIYHMLGSFFLFGGGYM